MTDKRLIVDEKEITLSSIDDKQSIIEEWLIQQFRDKVKKASIIASRIEKPFVLYSNILEENEDVAEEEIATVNEKYVIIQVFTRGGFIPTSFHKQYIFTCEKFASWAIKRKNRNVLLQCLSSLAEIK